MTRLIVLELTHTRIAKGQHCWAIWCRYVPGILGEVVAHDDGIVRTEDMDWDWSVTALREAA